jgi:hypothetical protein
MITNHYGLYFSDKTATWKNAKIDKMYDLSFRVNLVYKPKTIWFWIKKLFKKNK